MAYLLIVLVSSLWGSLWEGEGSSLSASLDNDQQQCLSFRRLINSTDSLTYFTNFHAPDCLLLSIARDGHQTN